VGEAGEKEKESARGTMGRGKREERPFPSSHRPPRALYFFDYFILMGIPSGSLCGGESDKVITIRSSLQKNKEEPFKNLTG